MKKAMMTQCVDGSRAQAHQQQSEAYFTLVEAGASPASVARRLRTCQITTKTNATVTAT